MTTIELARRIRIQSVTLTSLRQSPHVGSALSVADILAVLYNDILNINPNDPLSPERDRFILSKGHACVGVYSVLAEKGFFSGEKLNTFLLNGSVFPGHISHHEVPGVEFSTGSLGHGLPVGAGMALAAKADSKNFRTFVLLSDGECDEGSTWEAALFAAHHKLDNLVAIIDYNKIQSMGMVKEIMNLEPLAGKFSSFGWTVKVVDGHNVVELKEALLSTPEINKPLVIIANTVKGKGVSFMENSVLWHYKSPQGADLERALNELGV